MRNFEKALAKVMSMMSDFDSANRVLISELAEAEVPSALDSAWVVYWKESEANARVCVRGLKQRVTDIDSMFASAPCLAMLMLLIASPSSSGWTNLTLDIATAFLLAQLAPPRGGCLLPNPLGLTATALLAIIEQDGIG